MNLTITNLEHLPQEKTLLIHYNIDCSGDWQLMQLGTAYRNVCDDCWTVMFPNTQHPRHTDFTINVPMSGGTSATFAWNYGGIVGISEEDFDENHSYLVQLSVFNESCLGTSGGNSGSGSTSGNSGDRIDYDPREPKDRRPPDEPPQPPDQPPPTPGSVPGVNLPGNPGGPGGNPGGGQPGGVNTVNPNTNLPDSRDPFSGQDPLRIDRGYYDLSTYGFNQDSYNIYTRVDNVSNPLLKTNRSPVFTNPLAIDRDGPTAFSNAASKSFDDLVSFGNQFNGGFNNLPASTFNLNRTVDKLSNENTLRLVTAYSVVHGESFFASAVFYPSSEENNITLYLIAKDSRENWYLLSEKYQEEVSEDIPLQVSGKFNSGSFLQGDITVAVLAYKNGACIASKANKVRLLPQGAFSSLSSTDTISNALQRHLNLELAFEGFIKDPIEFIITGTGTFSSIIQCNSRIRYTAYTTSSILFQYEGKVNEKTDLDPLLYSAGFSNKPLESMTLRIEKISNETTYSPFKLFLSKNVTTPSYSATVLSWDGTNASIQVDTPYASQPYYLVVKDKDSSNKETPVIYSSSSDTSGQVTFSSVAISEDEYYAILLPKKGQVNINSTPELQIKF